MVMTIDAMNNDYPGEKVHISLCTDPENEYNAIKKAAGVKEKEEFNTFEFHRVDNDLYVLAGVNKICSEVFGQALNYAKVIGVSIPTQDIFKALKRMDS